MGIFEQASLPGVAAEIGGRVLDSQLELGLRWPRGRRPLPPAEREARIQARREAAREARRAAPPKPVSERQAARQLKWEAARNKLRGAAARFAGLSEPFRRHLATIEALRCIRRDRSGYKVTIYRKENSFDKTFSGFSPLSLQRAMRARDELLALWPPRRSHLIPPEVLRTLGLSGPITGITRFPHRSVYRLEFKDDGKERVQLFYFRHVPEADAYAAAVEFADKIFTEKGTSKLTANFAEERDRRIVETLEQLLAQGGSGESSAAPQTQSNDPAS